MATKIPDFLKPNFQYVVAKMRLPPGLCPGPRWGLSAPPETQLGNVGSHPCRGPHRFAGPRAPRPHDPPLVTAASHDKRTLFLDCTRYHVQSLNNNEADIYLFIIYPFFFRINKNYYLKRDDQLKIVSFLRTFKF